MEDIEYSFQLALLSLMDGDEKHGVHPVHGLRLQAVLQAFRERSSDEEIAHILAKCDAQADEIVVQKKGGWKEL